MGTKTVVQLREMAKNIGRRSYSPLETSTNEERHAMFNFSKQYPVHSKINDTISVHKHVTSDGKTKYETNDNKRKETVHRAMIKKFKAGENGLPFKHEVQLNVDRVKSSDVLPKGHATNVIYQHFKESDHPLVSSHEQFQKGHELWHRLVDKALDDGRHVYHWDSTRLHQVTHENKLKHLESSFGSADEFEHKHIILSKNKLND